MLNCFEYGHGCHSNIFLLLFPHSKREPVDIIQNRNICESLESSSHADKVVLVSNPKAIPKAIDETTCPSKKPTNSFGLGFSAAHMRESTWLNFEKVSCDLSFGTDEHSAIVAAALQTEKESPVSRLVKRIEKTPVLLRKDLRLPSLYDVPTCALTDEFLQANNLDISLDSLSEPESVELGGLDDLHVDGVLSVNSVDISDDDDHDDVHELSNESVELGDLDDLLSLETAASNKLQTPNTNTENIFNLYLRDTNLHQMVSKSKDSLATSKKNSTIVDELLMQQKRKELGDEMFQVWYKVSFWEKIKQEL